MRERHTQYYFYTVYILAAYIIIYIIIKEGIVHVRNTLEYRCWIGKGLSLAPRLDTNWLTQSGRLTQGLDWLKINTAQAYRYDGRKEWWKQRGSYCPT